MLGKIRKFSSSIFAKIFLVVVAIPFIFWGMGDLFSGGSQNTIFKIDKEKISTKEFINYINVYSSPEEKINSTFVEKMLSNFISAKIIESEIKNFNIVLSDDSLSKIIKNEEAFKRDNAFSLSTVRAGNVIGGGDWAQNRLVPDCIRTYMGEMDLSLRYPKAVRPWQFILEPLLGYLTLAAKQWQNRCGFEGAWNFGPGVGNHVSVGEVVKITEMQWFGAGREKTQIRTMEGAVAHGLPHYDRAS